MKLQKEITRHGKWYEDACGAAFAMELIGERWTVLILRELMLGGRRFSDIRASLPGISAKVLTERLEGLETIGVLAKRRLAPPAGASVYELTEWGYGLEPVMQELGRWAVRSPLHDPTLPITPVSFMLSLRTMIDPARAADFDLTVQFATGEAQFVATLAGGELAVRRADGEQTATDIAVRAQTTSHFLPVFYGKRPPTECGVEVTGDVKLFARFVDLFHLPAKCEAPAKRV